MATSFKPFISQPTNEAFFKKAEDLGRMVQRPRVSPWTKFACISGAAYAGFSAFFLFAGVSPAVVITGTVFPAIICSTRGLHDLAVVAREKRVKMNFLNKQVEKARWSLRLLDKPVSLDPNKLERGLERADHWLSRSESLYKAHKKASKTRGLTP